MSTDKLPSWASPLGRLTPGQIGFPYHDRILTVEATPGQTPTNEPKEI
jgi:hypothetical protein